MLGQAPSYLTPTHRPLKAAIAHEVFVLLIIFTGSYSNCRPTQAIDTAVCMCLDGAFESIQCTINIAQRQAMVPRAPVYDHYTPWKC